LRHEEVASAFQWIIERAYPTHPRQRSRTIRMVVGRDNIDENECAPDENIVSISESGIYFWYRPYSEPGAPRFAAARVNGLFDFMRIVVWPRAVGEWCEERLMLEPELTETEKSAIDLYAKFQDAEKEMTLRDIDRLLEDKPHLQGLYAAIRNSDAVELQKYAAELPGELVEIGRDMIQALVEPILQDQHEKAKSQRAYLIFRILHVAAMPLLITGQGWRSDDYSKNVQQSLVQIKYVGRLARRRYAKEFMAFCLSNEMLEIENRVFSGTPSGNRDSYCASVTSFVVEQLASADYAV
jgi:hypothetical protein